jgi:tripartite-type tricarboxylate transporter receptor subunit TctC
MYSYNVISDKLFNLKAKFVTGYRGGSAVATGLMRGDGDMGVLNLTNFFRYVKSGDLRVVLTYTEKRHPLTPNAPSVAELGYPQATVCKSWKVLFGPPGLPADIANTIHDALKKSLEDPKLQAWAAKANRPLAYLDGQTAWKDLLNIFKVYKQYR